jgi:voltage-gated potassium channel
MSRTAGMWLSRLRERRHLVLLVALVVMAVVQPSLVHWSVHTRVLGDLVLAAVAISVFLIVFEQRWERLTALVLAFTGSAGNLGYFYLGGGLQAAAIVLYHCSAVAFFGFAVAVILRGVFKRETIRADDIIGAACGYLLAAVAWANVYALTYVIAPTSFHVPGGIGWQLSNWHTRRALFDYFSIVSLTGLGYGDITPTSPPAYALVALEVVFGLFYLAVVVAQLVGLMMVHRMDRKKSS